jgi:hypothetical protein
MDEIVTAIGSGHPAKIDTGQFAMLENDADGGRSFVQASFPLVSPRPSCTTSLRSWYPQLRATRNARRSACAGPALMAIGEPGTGRSFRQDESI